MTCLCVGEYTVYNASVAKFNKSIASLKAGGVDVEGEVKLLKALQKRVTAVSELVVCIFFEMYAWHVHIFRVLFYTLS